jgi:hypothetical protein
MLTRERLRAFFAWQPVRTSLFVLGLLLMAATPVVGVLPGPGGIFVFAAGLALTLRNSEWAKRRYVRFKRWQPRAGAWADWGLRRPSARRRVAAAKERELAEAPPAHCVERIDDPLPHSGFEASPVDPTPAEIGLSASTHQAPRR